MNKLEKEMIEILKRSKDTYNIVATKAEFEAEGTRVDELLRLIDIANQANVDIALKVGGCEAIRDLLEAKQFGVKYIIAPMVETPYALKKFINAKNKVFYEKENNCVEFLFNLETYNSYKFLKELVGIAKKDNGCNGLVFGRVDFSGSMNLSRNEIEEEKITVIGEEIAQECKKADLDFVVGGAISSAAIPALKRFNKIKLNRFETRKIIFNSSALKNKDLEIGLKYAVKFELLWLLNKRDYYKFIYKEDEVRINMLEKRWNVLEKEF